MRRRPSFLFLGRAAFAVRDASARPWGGEGSVETFGRPIDARGPPSMHAHPRTARCCACSSRLSSVFRDRRQRPGLFIARGCRRARLARTKPRAPRRPPWRGLASRRKAPDARAIGAPVPWSLDRRGPSTTFKAAFRPASAQNAASDAGHGDAAMSLWKNTRPCTADGLWVHQKRASMRPPRAASERRLFFMAVRACGASGRAPLGPIALFDLLIDAPVRRTRGEGQRPRKWQGHTRCGPPRPF